MPDHAVAEHAPAKINLALHVVGRRADGYHLIESLSVFTAFGDRVTAHWAKADTFEITGRFGEGVPRGGDNLVLRARDAMRCAFPKHELPVAIDLEKNIPIQSGVGGGSSDAAATIRALAKLWGLEPDPETLSRIGLALGADVPMCLAARPLIARGIGEAIDILPDFPDLPLVLVNPGVAVSTPAIFAALERRDNPPLLPLPAERSVATLAVWLGATRNDLFEPARRKAPAIGDALDALAKHGAIVTRMSGSGATCWGLCRDQASATAIARAIAVDRPDWFVGATTSAASQPSPKDFQ